MLTNRMIADGKLAEIIAKFTECFQKNGSPDTMALFCGRTSYEKEFGKPVTRIYFSPACVNYLPELVFRYFAIVCETPKGAKLTLLAGPKSAFDLLDQIYMPLELSFD